MGGNEEDGARLFSVAPTDRTAVVKYKLKLTKLYLNTRKHFFYCEGGQTPEHVAQRGCGVSVCIDIQNLTGHGPGQAALAGPV